jgi:hypothetical protein
VAGATALGGESGLATLIGDGALIGLAGDAGLSGDSIVVTGDGSTVASGASAVVVGTSDVTTSSSPATSAVDGSVAVGTVASGTVASGTVFSTVVSTWISCGTLGVDSDGLARARPPKPAPSAVPAAAASFQLIRVGFIGSLLIWFGRFPRRVRCGVVSECAWSCEMTVSGC